MLPIAGWIYFIAFVTISGVAWDRWGVFAGLGVAGGLIVVEQIVIRILLARRDRQQASSATD